MGKKPRPSSASATATASAAVANAATATAAPAPRSSRHRASSAADATAGDLGLLLAVYQSLLGQLGTTLDSRRARDDLQALRNRTWDQVALAQQQPLPSAPQPPQASSPFCASPCMLAASVAYFADLLLLTHRLLQRFPTSVQPPQPPIPVGLQEPQRVPGGHHHGRMSAAAAAAAAASAPPWNPLADAERARSLAERLMQQQPPSPPSPTSEHRCMQQQPEETWSALIRTDSVDSLDSYVCRHEPVLLEIHAGSGSRRRRCVALVAVVLFVVITFAAVLGICITMLTPRQPP